MAVSAFFLILLAAFADAVRITARPLSRIRSEEWGRHGQNHDRPCSFADFPYFADAPAALVLSKRISCTTGDCVASGWELWGG